MQAVDEAVEYLPRRPPNFRGKGRIDIIAATPSMLVIAGAIHIIPSGHPLHIHQEQKALAAAIGNLGNP
ncbi:hypothetical protein QCA50_014492 [Cerrena zonata]|uniref:Uncharacterized protein n=1 Tax=Cerrena zonata TaxID=2478898 RepID=A0AAW0FRV1_9APHY